MRKLSEKGRRTIYPILLLIMYFIALTVESNMEDDLVIDNKVNIETNE